MQKDNIIARMLAAYREENETNDTLQQVLTDDFIEKFTRFGSLQQFLAHTELTGDTVVTLSELSFMKKMKINAYVRSHSMFQSLAHLLQLAQEYKVKREMIDRLYKQTTT